MSFERRIQNKKIALITGATKGIGREILFELARQDFYVIGCGRAPKDIKAVELELKTQGLSGEMVKVDVTRTNDLERLTRTIRERAGKLQVVVNNAGGAERFGSFDQLTEEDWRRSYELNVVSVVGVVQAMLPFLKKCKSSRIINISSVTGQYPGYFNPHYSASKAALNNLSKHLANTLAASDILVNTVCPGPVVTHSWEKNVKNQAKKRGISQIRAAKELEESEVKKIPLRRVGKCEDVTGLVAFLASEKASWITGASFNVDGGKSPAIF